MFSLSSIHPSPAASLPPPELPLPLSSLSSSPHRLPCHRPSIHPLRISNIDAVQPHSSNSDHLYTNNSIHGASISFPKLKIAVIGFGNYGQFLAKTLVRQGHTVLAHSRSDYSRSASELGVFFFSDPNDLCEEHPDVILLCTSILSTESVLRSLPLQRLKRSTLFVDVLSVKEFPRSLFIKLLPRDFDILCTHPMFGPESGKNGWGGLSFVYDKVRIGKSEARVNRCENFINAFAREGCRMVEMSCADHDKYAAGSQFITHMTGRVLEELNLKSSPIDTKGYQSLLNLVDNTSKDSFELFYGLFSYNMNAREQMDRMGLAFEMVKQQLFGNMQTLLRKRLLLDDYEAEVFESKPTKLLPVPTSQHISLLLPSSSSPLSSSHTSEKVDIRC